LSPSIAFNAAPGHRHVIAGELVLGQQLSTSAPQVNSSGSSTRSHLLRKTTTAGHVHLPGEQDVLAGLRIGPSTALTTRIAPSICAAPVIMFFT